jgi:hypothetical protein
MRERGTGGLERVKDEAIGGFEEDCNGSFG